MMQKMSIKTENETFLKWILIQRAKYFKKSIRFDDDIFGWFIIPENKEKEIKDELSS